MLMYFNQINIATVDHLMSIFHQTNDPPQNNLYHIPLIWNHQFKCLILILTHQKMKTYHQGNLET